MSLSLEISGKASGVRNNVFQHVTSRIPCRFERPHHTITKKVIIEGGQLISPLFTKAATSGSNKRQQQASSIFKCDKSCENVQFREILVKQEQGMEEGS